MQKVHELALSWGRKRQSKTTSFLHFNPQDPYGEGKETIPFYENILFTLALLRSKTADQILEAKALLEKLLLFENQGNFPRFLHEYPRCFDSDLPKKLSLPFSLIVRDFENVLGKELGEKLKRFTAPINLSLFSHYHFDLGCHVGPYEEVWQEKGEPALTFSDLQAGKFSPRILSEQPIHLHGALIDQPIYKEASAEGWHLYQAPTCAYSVRKLWKDDGAQVSKGFHLFALLWKGGDHIHSLVCQKKNQMTSTASEKGFELDFTLPELIPQEGLDRMEVLFYCNIHPDHVLFIDQKRATTFQLGDHLEIKGRQHTVSMTFEVVEGEGTFFGHLTFANRPSQILPAEQLRFAAHDWQIGLRTVRRSPHLKIRARISITTPKGS